MLLLRRKLSEIPDNVHDRDIVSQSALLRQSVGGVKISLHFYDLWRNITKGVGSWGINQPIRDSAGCLLNVSITVLGESVRRMAWILAVKEIFINLWMSTQHHYFGRVPDYEEKGGQVTLVNYVMVLEVFDTESFLMTVQDEVQAGIAESLLRSFGIPTARNYREAGSYVKVIYGMSSFGIDIYVPTHRLEEAKDIVKSSSIAQAEPQVGETEPEFPRAAYGTRKQVVRWLIVIVFLIPAAVSMVLAIVRYALGRPW
jgi:hypothetical protein